MKKFRFRLETPLKLRRRKVDQCGQTLAVRRQELQTARRECDLLEAERAHWGRSYLLNSSGEIDIARDFRRREYLDLLDARILSQKTLVSQCLKRVQEAEEALRLAVRDREILERLKEIRHQSHINDIRALEAKRADFAAATLFRRNAP